ncbi:FliA/WhiG family RNA polymerase sigma factor [Patulibacter sp. SYSU D01012]|uniref:sigma-70 family RNA polymerase sigma factor n=1 Tax=Patulibacter sp. SYSU D01012 TaxID=2817381 RepID=UPI001B31665E|nr:FliA/WhiG family RNA polymerase sigma factor [Patulibacter sp. SYSU D01012]
MTSTVRPVRQRRATTEQLLRKWRMYRKTGDRAKRDELVFLLTPLVRHIVSRKVRQLPAYCEMDDLAAAGLEALVVSIERFDPAKGATLEQFAWTRINGAVLDELRRRDWAPRSLRRWEREAETARRELRSRLEREPNDFELAEHLETSSDEIRARRDQLALAEVESLATSVAGSDGTLVDRTETIVSADRSSSPERMATVREARAHLAAAVAALPDRERDVARLLYVENLRLREIGDMLGVSESRVCQIASSLRSRLRAALGDHADLLVASLD